MLWTRQNVDGERAAFFDTRVTGREEVWQVLHAALEALWDSEGTAPTQQGRRDTDVGLMTAQSILDAADVTVPTGDLVSGAYDSLGNFYQVPEWVACDPTGLAEEAFVGKRLGQRDEVIGGGNSKENDGSAQGASTDESEETVVKRREAKGKAVLKPGETLRVKARLSDRGGPDVLVTVGKDESTRAVARRVGEAAGVSFPLSHLRRCFDID